MESLIHFLSKVPDIRRKEGQRWSFPQFLEMMVLAGMSGHFGIRPIARFIENNSKFFINRYNLQHGTPSKTSVQNTLSEIPFESLNLALEQWIKQHISPEDDLWISIDGKTLCSTVNNKQSANQNYKSIVSAFVDQYDLTLSSQEMEIKKSGEGNAARNLISKLELQGVTFTLDALHCQKKRQTKSWIQEMSI